ncbi:MAG: COX15/CtaA family protein [Pseudomonadales bacterium]
MDNSAKTSATKTRWLLRCLIALLTVTITVNLISAYIRLDEAGTGCQPWPDCYARVGGSGVPEPLSAADALTPVEVIKQAHRTVATLLVVIVLAVIGLARGQPLGRTARMLPYAIAFTVLLLAVVGPASYLKTLPAVATVNLAGGMTLLALTWLLWLDVTTMGEKRLPVLKAPARLALAALIIQILFGAWVSANFAAAGCTGFLSCAQGGAGLESFWYLRELSVDPTGRILQDGSQAVIQRAHHSWALVTTLTLVWLGWCGTREVGRPRLWGSILLAVLLLQLSLGLAGLAASMPLPVVLLHNLVASLLLLCVLRFLVLSRDRQEVVKFRTSG